MFSGESDIFLIKQTIVYKQTYKSNSLLISEVKDFASILNYFLSHRCFVLSSPINLCAFFFKVNTPLPELNILFGAFS